MARRTRLMRISPEFELAVNKIYNDRTNRCIRTTRVDITKEFANMASVIDKQSKHDKRYSKSNY